MQLILLCSDSDKKYNTLSQSKPVRVSSAEHKRRYFEECCLDRRIDSHSFVLLWKSMGSINPYSLKYHLLCRLEGEKMPQFSFFPELSL